MQDLNDMVYFAEVADKGGFSAAGRSLGLPKSRLSRRVAELETRLGVRLLQRTTRKLSLTAVGEVFHRHCVAMREEALAAVEAVDHSHTEPRGLIRIACPVTLAQTAIAQILPHFLARYPQVTIDMQVNNRPVDLVDEGFDVALRVRNTLDASGSMVVKKLGSSTTLLVSSPEQIKRQGQPQRPQDLANYDTVAMSTRNGHATWQLMGPSGAAVTVEHTPRLVADDLLTLKLAVLQGVGIGWMPDYMCVDDFASGALAQVLPGWSPPLGIVHAVFPSRRRLVPAVRKFLDFLAENMQGEIAPVSPGASVP